MCVGIATLKREPCVEVDVAPSAEDMDRFGRRSAGAVEPLCDDANPDDDMSRPAPDRSEEQQGKRKRDVKPDHVELPRKRTGRFDSATMIIPQTRKPANPQTRKPANPQTRKPANPQTRKPANPQTRKPANPQTRKPANPQTRKPANPQTRKPANP